MSLPARRAAVVLAAGAAAVLGLAGPAAAHVEVTATPPRALATGAVLTLSGEAESDTAGVTGVRIQLPAGMLPADFRLAGAPAGWRLTGSAQVLSIGGPALPVGRDLRLTLKVRQLPDTDRLVLKTVQTYSDKTEDAWIELPSASVPEPDQPAPVVTLQSAAPGATPVPRATAPAPTSAAPTTAAAPSSAAPSSAAAAPTASASPAAAAEDSGSMVGWLFGGVAFGLLLLGGVVIAARRTGVPRA